MKHREQTIAFKHKNVDQIDYSYLVKTAPLGIDTFKRAVPLMPLYYIISLLVISLTLLIVNSYNIMLVFAGSTLFALVVSVLSTYKDHDKIFLSDVHSNLRDECKAIMFAVGEIDKALEIAPEKLAVEERANEFKKLAWTFLESAKGINDTRSGRATNKALHKKLDVLRTKGIALKDAGLDLCDIVSNQRLDSIVQEVEVSGIDAFVENVSLTTMAYRALEAPDEEPKTDKVFREPIPKNAQSYNLDQSVAQKHLANERIKEQAYLDAYIRKHSRLK